MKAILKTIVLAVIVLSSCQKQDDPGLLTNDSSSTLKSAEVAVNDVLIESVLEELNYDADFYAASEHLLRKLAYLSNGRNLLAGETCGRYADGNFPDVSIDTSDTETGYPLTITIDYGDSTVFFNRVVVSGIVTIEISAPRRINGATRTITFVCMVNSVSIEGTCIEIFEGDNEFRRQITRTMDLNFGVGDTLSMHRTGVHVRNWISGLDTPFDLADDTIQITGNTEVTCSSGDTWTRVIREPLIKTGACRHFISGIITFNINNELVAVLDYGDGTCDNICVLKVNGEEIEIELHGKFPLARLKAHLFNQHRN